MVSFEMRRDMQACVSALEDIQQLVNKAVQIILKTTQNVHEWKHHRLLHQYTTPVVDDINKGKYTNF